MSSSKGSKTSRARAIAAKRRAEQLAAERRRKAIIASLIAVAVLVAAGIVGVAWYVSQNSTPENFATPKNGSTTGVMVGKSDAPVTVDIYLDYQCPACKQMEERIGSTVDTMVTEGKIKVNYHPVAYLNRFSSGTEYSTRSSIGAACAADDDVFAKYTAALFANQPDEGGTGLTDEKLAELAKGAGASDAFGSCLSDKKYADWTSSVTDGASKAGYNTTPTVLVGDQKFDGSVTVEQFTAAVTAAA